MKKGVSFTAVKLLLILFLFLITINFISAVEITLSKDSYQPEETLQAQITGNFISLDDENVFIYREGKVHPEPVIKDLTKQNNIYYFYAVLPKQPGNYSLKIQDTNYLERGELKSEIIEKQIKLDFKNVSDLSFNPGFFTPNEDLLVKVKSLYGNTLLTARFEATRETKNLSLIEQKEETLKFKLPELPSQLSKITINSYEIPVFLIKKIAVNETIKIEFIPYKLDGIVITKKDYFFKVVLKNSGNNLTNIKLYSNLKTVIAPEKIAFLESNKTIIINITLSILEINQTKLLGQITAETDNNLFYLPISFNITKNETEAKIAPAEQLSCSQIGKTCNEKEFCDGESVESLEGACCIGQCLEEKKSSVSKIIGIILLIILVLIIIYLIIKIRQRKKLKSPEEILREKSGRFKQRFQGGEKDEVSGRLDKV